MLTQRMRIHSHNCFEDDFNKLKFFFHLQLSLVPVSLYVMIAVEAIELCYYCIIGTVVEICVSPPTHNPFNCKSTDEHFAY